jgi:hypothetical protein
MATNTNNGVFGNTTATAKSSVYTVQVADFGYHISSTTSETPMDLRNRLGILTNDRRQGVIDTFTAVHNLINSPCDNFRNVLKLGDYIDLPFLYVERDPGNDLPSCEIALDTNNANINGNDSLLRIVIIGLDSYTGINGNNTPHVVFQFKHAPVIARVESTGASIGSKWGHLPWYLNENFLEGLASAGLTWQYLWNPIRVYTEMVAPPSAQYYSGISYPYEWEILNYFTGDSLSGIYMERAMEIRAVARNQDPDQVLTYNIWVPSELEMFGKKFNSLKVETASNQANFTGYYKDNASRIKRGMASNHAPVQYWTSSSAVKTGIRERLSDSDIGSDISHTPFEYNGFNKYVTVSTDGTPSSAYQQLATVGVSPAFCIK